MTPKSKPHAYLTPGAYQDLRRLPGNVKRQMIKAIDDLERNLRPKQSIQLELGDDPREIRRLRLGKWRILYLVQEETPVIFGIRQRPPYDYEDLQALIGEIE
jgi:mRNA interferase RelE/StbE